MTISNHILSQEGILTSFSIAKKVTVKDVKKLQSKLKSDDINSEKFQELLKQSVVEEAASCIKNNQIPGLIVEGQLENDADRIEEDKKIMELTYFSSLIAKKITEKKMDKYHACYIINVLVNMLGLDDKSFDDFHKRFSKYKNGGKETDDTGNSEESSF